MYTVHSVTCDVSLSVSTRNDLNHCARTADRATEPKPETPSTVLHIHHISSVSDPALAKPLRPHPQPKKYATDSTAHPNLRSLSVRVCIHGPAPLHTAASPYPQAIYTQLSRIWRVDRRSRLIGIEMPAPPEYARPLPCSSPSEAHAARGTRNCVRILHAYRAMAIGDRSARRAKLCHSMRHDSRHAAIGGDDIAWRRDHVAGHDGAVGHGDATRSHDVRWAGHLLWLRHVLGLCRNARWHLRRHLRLHGSRLRSHGSELIQWVRRIEALLNQRLRAFIDEDGLKLGRGKRVDLPTLGRDQQQHLRWQPASCVQKIESCMLGGGGDGGERGGWRRGRGEWGRERELTRPNAAQSHISWLGQGSDGSWRADATSAQVGKGGGMCGNKSRRTPVPL